tara:strand:+ start:491 stop:898 length:408 start_codon:yes stop_codon:yes gene_type:complete
MFNYKPVLALSIILFGFLVSISIAFLDILGPSVPLPRKNIFEILKTYENSSLLSAKENISANYKRRSAELYLNQKNLVHGYSNLDFNGNLSNPENGKFIYFTSLCYGNSENDCIYRNTYIKSSDNGDTWKIGFLE